jgi:type IV pilus assembly protein PilB
MSANRPVTPPQRPPQKPGSPGLPPPLDVVGLKISRALVAEGRMSAGKADALAAATPAPDARRLPGWFLVSGGAVTEKEWVERIAAHFGLASGQISDFNIDRTLIARVPEDTARRGRLLPLVADGAEVYVAIIDPTQLAAVDHVRSILGKSIRPIVVAPSELDSALDRVYLAADTSDLEHLAGAEEDLTAGELAKLREAGESGAAVQTIDRLLAHAIQNGASDIHIETTLKDVRVRFRVDGVLREGPRYPVTLAPMLVSRVKVLAQLDISERWVPQDGRVRLRKQGQELDLRISTVPVNRGEKVVIRLLAGASGGKNLRQLGHAEHMEADLLREVARPHGMVLVTGPTGSGKTSTLYALLRHRATPEVNVVTIEDPVEYEVEGLNQIPINTKRGMTFSGALRAVLRQDPDVVLLGEIRDRETAIIAAEAALTGHLLLSTLHTNDAASAVQRLLEMGVPRCLLAPVLSAVVAQRLVRKICTECAQNFQPTQAQLDALSKGIDARLVVLRKGAGCPRCEGSGYRGRVPVAELIPFSDDLRQMIADGASRDEIAKRAQQKGCRTLLESSLELLFAGETSIEEVSRVIAT